MERTFTADRGDAGQRIDSVVLRHLGDVPALSRTRVQAWIGAGHVLIGGRVAGKPSSRVPAGASVRVHVAEPLPVRRLPQPECLALDVLYEDDWLLAVNKAAGVVAHPAYKHPCGTVLNGLLWLARDWPDGTRPSLVQRLDKDTSGVLLVARTRAVHAALQRAMHSGAVEKIYLAVVHGRPQPAHGRIDLPLGRDMADRRRVVAAVAGRASVTSYERIATAGRGADALSLVRCRLGTGRMHQIRVHLAARGWPIVGDASYGRTGDTRLMVRQALHAHRVMFAHPVTGAPIAIEAPVPADLGTLIASIEATARPRSGKSD